ncbi:Hypothetical protein NTJ_14136 [Nesidiocoris tenuis]|uniref:Uncharacterized protein n=1 Tax=Nesidiocoris tenuis TaxID=355587 RepID=A0ABN7BAA2_9HEMI|nr:Hypothetical protein NTJ_14136 [Nesidiocoris tenuis]
MEGKLCGQTVVSRITKRGESPCPCSVCILAFPDPVGSGRRIRDPPAFDQGPRQGCRASSRGFAMERCGIVALVRANPTWFEYSRKSDRRFSSK